MSTPTAPCPPVGEAITGGEQARKYLPMIRSLVDAVMVRDDENAPDHAPIAVVGSLATVLSIATA